MHPELESEQAYVDHAYACLEEMRRQVERAGDAGIGAIFVDTRGRGAQIEIIGQRGVDQFDQHGIVEHLRPLQVGQRLFAGSGVGVAIRRRDVEHRPLVIGADRAPGQREHQARYEAAGQRGSAIRAAIHDA